jgi:hypothetical protein
MKILRQMPTKTTLQPEPVPAVLLNSERWVHSVFPERARLVVLLKRTEKITGYSPSKWSSLAGSGRVSHNNKMFKLDCENA